MRRVGSHIESLSNMVFTVNSAIVSTEHYPRGPASADVILAVDPVFDGFRSDQHFQDLLTARPPAARAALAAEKAPKTFPLPHR
jgi:hypothetical protein